MHKTLYSKYIFKPNLTFRLQRFNAAEFSNK